MSALPRSCTHTCRIHCQPDDHERRGVAVDGLTMQEARRLGAVRRHNGLGWFWVALDARNPFLAVTVETTLQALDRGDLPPEWREAREATEERERASGRAYRAEVDLLASRAEVRDLRAAAERAARHLERFGHIGAAADLRGAMAEAGR